MRLLYTLLLAVAAVHAQDALGPPAEMAELLKVRRLYVEKLAGGDTAAHMRDMIVAALQLVKLYQITENLERADVVLRGSAEDLIFTDTFQTSEGLTARTQIGGSAARSANLLTRGIGASVGDHESMRIVERKHEATASVRLVNREGDVIWSTTQESSGGKFRGAAADVADRIAKRLLEDVARVRGAAGPASSEK